MTNDSTEPRPNGQSPAAAELDQLLSGLCDGTLGDDDRRLLSRRLADEPQARRLYLEYVDLHAVLVGCGPAAPLVEPDAARAVDAAPAKVAPRLRIGRWGTSFAAIAALTLVAVWVAPGTLHKGKPPAQTARTGPSYVEQPPEPHATTGPYADVRLSQLAGKVEISGASGEATDATAATVVGAGRTVRTGPDDGAVTLNFPDGSRVDLAADTQLRLADLSGGVRLVLSRGALRADVKPQPAGRPMVVVTPQAEVRVLGTLFTVTAGESTAVETDEGKVRVVRTGDGRAADVPAGYYLITTGDESDLAVRAVPDLVTEPRGKLGYDRANALAYSPDGRRVTAASLRRFATLRADSGDTAHRVGTKVAADDVLRTFVSGDGSAVLSVRRGGQIDVYDAASGAMRTEISTGFPSFPQAVAVSANGRRIAAYEPGSYRPGRVRVWDAQGVDQAMIVVDTTVRALTFSSDGRRLAAATVRPGQFQDRRLTVWDMESGARVMSTVPLDVPLDLLAYSPDGRQIAGADERGAVHVWNATTGDWLATRDVADGWTCRVRALVFSPDGQFVAAGGADGRIRLWDVARARDVSVLVCGHRPVLTLAFAPDGRTLAAGAVAGPVLLWDVPATSPQ